MTASFGGLVFKAGRSSPLPVKDWTREMTLSAEAQDQDKDKPSTLIKGIDLEQMQFSAPLVRQLGVNPERTIEQLRQLLAGKVAYKFVMGGKPVGQYLWLLKAVSVSDVVLNGRGEILAAVVKLTLEEYVRAGTPTAAGGAAAAAGISSVSINDAYKVQTASADEKAALKRGGR